MSLSNPTIWYETSSTELFSLLESGKKDVDVDSVSVKLIGRLLPCDVLSGDNVVVMMSSGSGDTEVGNSGTADVLTGASVEC